MSRAQKEDGRNVGHTGVRRAESMSTQSCEAAYRFQSRAHIYTSVQCFTVRQDSNGSEGRGP